MSCFWQVNSWTLRFLQCSLAANPNICNLRICTAWLHPATRGSPWHSQYYNYTLVSRAVANFWEHFSKIFKNNFSKGSVWVLFNRFFEDLFTLLHSKGKRKRKKDIVLLMLSAVCGDTEINPKILHFVITAQ